MEQKYEIGQESIRTLLGHDTLLKLKAASL